MSEYSVKKIEKSYPLLTLDLKTTKPCEYELGLIIAYTSELERGFKVGNQYKSDEDGTKIDFVPFENQEDIESYEKLILKMAKDFEQKYEGWDILSLIKK